MYLRYCKFELQTCMRDGLCFEFSGERFFCLVVPLPPFCQCQATFLPVPFFTVDLNLAHPLQWGCSCLGWEFSVSLLLDSPSLVDSLFYFLSPLFPTIFKMESLVSGVEKSAGRSGTLLIACLLIFLVSLHSWSLSSLLFCHFSMSLQSFIFLNLTFHLYSEGALFKGT